MKPHTRRILWTAVGLTFIHKYFYTNYFRHFVCNPEFHPASAITTRLPEDGAVLAAWLRPHEQDDPG